MSPLPCPFCGGSRLVSASGKNPARRYYVTCDDLTCMGHSTEHGFATPEEAITAWNRRAMPRQSGRHEGALFFGVTSRNLVQGETLAFEIDDTGRLRCEAIRFELDAARG